MKKNLATSIGLAVLAIILPLGGMISAVAGTAVLSDAEQVYYNQIFDYVMDNIDSGKTFDWKTAGGNGTIKVGDPFISKSQSNCRGFAETFSVQGNAGASNGFACRRKGSDGWCRLKATDMQSCALEKPGFILGNTPNITAPSISGPNITMPDVSVGSVNINMPGVHVPSMPNLPSMGGSGNRGGAQQNGSASKDGNKGGSASGAAYDVTDTLGSGAAKGTGMALGWFKDWFR